MLHRTPPSGLPSRRREAQRGLGLILAVAIALMTAGCGGQARTDPDTEPKPVGRLMASDQPIIVIATIADQPNVVNYNLLNQSDRDCVVNDRFFALILPGERKPRVFTKNYDWAQLGSLVVPAEGQAVGRIEWRDVPPLAGARLVFNPEGTGFPPAFGVIEKIVTTDAGAVPEASQR